MIKKINEQWDDVQDQMNYNRREFDKNSDHFENDREISYYINKYIEYNDADIITIADKVYNKPNHNPSEYLALSHIAADRGLHIDGVNSIDINDEVAQKDYSYIKKINNKSLYSESVNNTSIKKFYNYNENLNNILSRDEKIDAIIEFTSKDEDSAEADRGDLNNLNDEMLDKFYNNIFKQTNEGVTVSSPGSGTAVGGGSEGSFVSSMGVSVSGGDSGSAFATNSSVSGMGKIVSPQPSDIPGDVRGSTKGSGDIGSRGGVYTKQTTGKRNKKKKSSRSKIASDIDKLYTTNYRETSDNGKIIQSWSKFNEK